MGKGKFNMNLGTSQDASISMRPILIITQKKMNKNIF